MSVVGKNSTRIAGIGRAEQRPVAMGRVSHANSGERPFHNEENSK